MIQTNVFAGVLEYLEQASKPSVLDAGQANPSLVNILGSYHDVKYFTLGFRSAIIEIIRDTPSDDLSSRVGIGLPEKWIDNYKRISEDAPIGVILAWDLFNYISRDGIVDCMAQISPLCNRGTLLHCLIWLDAGTPLFPTKFRFSNERQIIMEHVESKKLKVPPMSAQSLNSLMPSFNIVRLAALSLGLHECLLEFEELTNPPNPNLITLETTAPYYIDYSGD